MPKLDLLLEGYTENVKIVDQNNAFMILTHVGFQISFKSLLYIISCY